MPINLNSIKTSDATGAEADRVTLQTFIDDNNKAGDVIAKIADLKRCTAFIIPVARSAEFDAASEADKIKFCEINEIKFIEYFDGESKLLDLDKTLDL